MRIIQYNDASDIIVQFEKGCIVKTKYSHFKNGMVKSPFDLSVYNVGYLGEGKYKVWDNNKHTIYYSYWKHMLERCYSQKYHIRETTYKDCIVCEEWHNFQVFSKWVDDNYYYISQEQMQLDKDILHKGNKIYSPENCVFVPQSINKLFTKANNIRGKCPLGITCLDSKWFANCYDGNNKQIYLGSFETKEKAFQVYKQFKEKTIKQKADKYKEYIPNNLYKAMYSYEVQISD